MINLSQFADSKAWEGKSAALGRLNEFDEAIKACDTAIEINLQDPDALKSKETLSKQIK